MTERVSEQKSYVETMMFLEPKRQTRVAWGVAIAFGAIATAQAISIAYMMPLKESVPYLGIVDKDTGQAERVVEVSRANINDSDAIKQSLLFGYVVDRETFDPSDNEARIPAVYRKSAGSAAQDLRNLWSPENPNYPPKLYGDSSRIKVKILSITPVTANTATVRFEKIWTAPNTDDRIGKFFATVTYEFQPAQQSTVEMVWENPMGFTVTGYRTNAESMEAQQYE